MTVRCEYKSNGVIVWHSGVITDEMLLIANKELYAHEYKEGLQFQLLELTDVQEFNVSSVTMAQLAEMDRKINKGKKVFACVVAPDDLMFGLSRMWDIQAGGDDLDTMVVRTINDAIAWFASKGIRL